VLDDPNGSPQPDTPVNNSNAMVPTNSKRFVILPSLNYPN
jgi:hypothetical protein